MKHRKAFRRLALGVVIAAALAWLAWHFGLSPAARARWLVQELHPPNPFRRFLAKTRLAPLRQQDEVVWELAAIGEPAVLPLIGALKHENPTVRESAARALGKIRPAAKQAVPALIAAMKDKGPFVRMSAASTLGTIGPAAGQAVPALIAAMKDEDAGVRAPAAEALGEIAPAAKEAVPALQEAAKGKDADLSAAARAALERIQGGQETHGP